MDAEALQTYYTARAPEYDHVYRKPERQHDLREIERWLPATLGSRAILEVACGTGYWTQFLAPVASELVALDASATVLRIARDRVHRGRVSFVRGDACRVRGLPSSWATSIVRWYRAQRSCFSTIASLLEAARPSLGKMSRATRISYAGWKTAPRTRSQELSVRA